MQDKMVQPGVVLHEAIDGVFRAAGTSFNNWCKTNGIHPSTARNATFGQSGGPNGRKLLDKMIEEAGQDLVLAAYRKRMLIEAERLAGEAMA